jgi:hypothetical protein
VGDYTVCFDAEGLSIGAVDPEAVETLESIGALFTDEVRHALDRPEVGATLHIG